MNPKRQKLLEKAEQTLQAARVLRYQGFFDSATSRGDYGMFYIATAFLEGEELSYSRHSAVIASFGQNFARRVPIEFHRYLIDAQNIRLKADYDVNAQITQKEASQTIDRAEKMLNFA